MASHRALKLPIVATVLAAAWYAGREAAPAMGITVAGVGLAAAHWRAVLGIPVAVAMAAAAVHVPGLAIGATVLVAFLAIVSFLVKRALTLGPTLSSRVSPSDASLFFGPSSGGYDGGGFDGGGCDGGF
jgi:uncharacterized membrane protein YgcG